MRIITLLTDFGLRDTYVGIMKGVIWSIAPDAQIVDLTHQITPQRVLEGALALNRAVSFFPEGTIHLAVVDPGVGTARRPMAAQLAGQYFVGPDNGLFTPFIENAEGLMDGYEIVHLNQPRYWLPEVSKVFHGRDIFAPVAAHLANGVPLRELGTRITDPVKIKLPEAEPSFRGWNGQVMVVDGFGNLGTNLTGHMLSSQRHAVIRIGDLDITETVQAFGERPAGSVVALINSAGNLEIAVVNGSAADKLGAHVGDPVEIIYQ